MGSADEFLDQPGSDCRGTLPEDCARHLEQEQVAQVDGEFDSRFFVDRRSGRLRGITVTGLRRLSLPK